MHVVELAARRAGFHPDAVVGILFDPCCVTRSPITNMNRLHRFPTGQPLPAPDGDEAQERDDRDAFHISDLDCYSAQRDARIAARQAVDNAAGESDASTSDDDDDASAAGEGSSNAADADRSGDGAGTEPVAPTAGRGNSIVTATMETMETTMLAVVMAAVRR